MVNAWKPILAAIVIFAAGVVTGGLVLDVATPQPARAFPRTFNPDRGHHGAEHRLGSRMEGQLNWLMRRIPRALKLTDEQTAKVEAAFKEHDTNGQGTCDADELVGVLRSLDLLRIVPSVEETALHEMQVRTKAMRRRREPPGARDRDGARVRARAGPGPGRRRGAAAGARAAGRPRRPRRRPRRRADTEPPRALRAGLAPPQFRLPAPKRPLRRPGARWLPVRRAVRSRLAGLDAKRQRRRPERAAHEAHRPRALATGLRSRRGLRRHETSAGP